MSDLNKLKADWASANEEYDACFQGVLFTLPRTGDTPSSEHREAVRAYWSSLTRILNLYVDAFVGHGFHLEPTPYVQLFRLALICEDLGDGIVPDVIDFARASGRPYGWTDRRDISRAVFFLLAVEAGEIEERAPIKTVADCFNVTKQTVRNWRSRADDFCKGQERPHLKMIEESMRNAGNRYSLLGRGAPSE